MQLRDYQIELSSNACQLLKSYGIAYLSMQVRTGKTITSLETAKQYGAKNVLFVTKLKAIQSITDDYNNAGYPESFEIVVINFESLHKLDQLTDSVFDLVIIDEAHSLGQFPIPAERTKLLKQICYAKPIIYLSGTPSPESYSQLFHQFWVSSRSPFGHSNFYQWSRMGYVQPQNKYVFNRTIVDYSNANKAMIDERVGHLFLSYTQEEAGFSELVNEHVHYVKMSDKTYKICERLRLDKIVNGTGGRIIEADTAVKLMNKLHQLYSGTVLFDQHEVGDCDSSVLDDSKGDYIFDKFQGKKMAIYYKFVAERMALEIQCNKRGIHIAKTPEEFNQTDNCVFLCQFVSGREGINLSTADCLICYNIDFSAVTYFQVRARLQSKERTTAADVHWIFAENGIETSIYETVKNKKNYTLSYFKKYNKL